MITSGIGVLVDVGIGVGIFVKIFVGVPVAVGVDVKVGPRGIGPSEAPGIHPANVATAEVIAAASTNFLLENFCFPTEKDTSNTCGSSLVGLLSSISF